MSRERNWINWALRQKGQGRSLASYSPAPIQFVDEKGELKKGWIEDVETNVEKVNKVQEQFTLKVVVLHEDKETFSIIRKTCLAPIGCEVDWETVHCAFEIENG